jgi:hypothetical protein
VSLTSSPKILLQRLGLRPKKTLGQNFLVHPHQARRIVAALELGFEETVAEIGAAHHQSRTLRDRADALRRRPGSLCRRRTGGKHPTRVSDGDPRRNGARSF